jgi:hypothetical protein
MTAELPTGDHSQQYLLSIGWSYKFRKPEDRITARSVAEGGCSGGRERGRRKREPELDIVPRDEVDDAAQNDSDGGSWGRV